MAFRKFSQPTPMKAAKFEGMPNLISSIQQNQVLKAKERDAAAKVKATAEKAITDLDTSIEQGAYVQDQEAINKIAKEGTNMYVNDMRTNGRESVKTMDTRQSAKNMANKSKQQFSEFQRLKTDATKLSTNDPYFNYSLADATIRNEEIKSIDERDSKNISLDGDEYFLDEQYLADWITKQNETVKNPVYKNGKTVGHKEVRGQFLDDKGNILVTNDDAKAYLDSDRKESIHSLYNSKLDAQLDAEINSLRGSGASWMDGLTHNEIKTSLINNPELNQMDGRTFAERKLELVKNDLTQGAKIDKLTNTNFVERTPTKTKMPGGDKEVQRQIRGGEREENLFKMIKGLNKASLNSVLGGLKGVSSYEFTYEDVDFVKFPQDEPKITGVTLKVPYQIKGVTLYKPVPLKFGTEKDDKESAVIISKLMDDDISGETPRIGSDHITKILDESDRWTSKNKKENDAEYSFGGKKYTNADLIKQGYTEEQIQQAIDMGNITINQ